MKRKISYIALIFAIIGLLSGCSPSVRFSSTKFISQSHITKTKTHTPNITKDHKNSTIQKPKFNTLTESSKELQIRKITEKWIGTPYCISGYSKDCTDCSGFVQSVYKELGISLPRTAKEQSIYTEKIAESSAVTGDLVFFSKNGSVNHVGIYLSNGTFVHASSSKGVVIEELTTTYYSKNFAGFGRIREFYSMN
jgi:cell wall-associated NlpC family hydrolase